MLKPSEINKEIAETEKLLEKLIGFWEKIPIRKKEYLRARLCKMLNHIYFERDGVYEILQCIVDEKINSKSEIEKYRIEWFKYAPDVSYIVEFFHGLDSNFLKDSEKINLNKIADSKSKLRNEINQIWYDHSIFDDIHALRQNSKGHLNLINSLNQKIDNFRVYLKCNKPVTAVGEFS